MVERRHLGLPAGVHYGGGDGLGDDGRPADDIAGPGVFAAEQARVAPFATAEHAHRVGRLQGACTGRQFGERLLRGVRHTQHLDGDGFGHQRLVRHQEGVALAVGGLERGAHRGDVAEGHDQSVVGAVVAQVHVAQCLDAAGGHALLQQLGGAVLRQLVEPGGQFGQGIVGQDQLDRLLAHHALVGQSDAIGRGQHAGQGMREHPAHAEPVGHQAGGLAAGAAEGGQHVTGHVVAALHGDLLDRVGHVADGDLDKALGDLLGRAPVAGGLENFLGQRGELLPDDVSVQRLVGVQA